jgi:Leucine-rich repeat (LRR) protein
MAKCLLALAAVCLTIAIFVPNGSGKCADSDDDDAKNAIKSAGGEVGYFDTESGQEENDEERIKEDSKQSKPRLARSVRIVNTNLSDIGLKELSTYLARINPQRLDLRFTKVTGIEPGVDLWQSLDLPNLVDLDLSSTPVSVRQLHELRHLGKLKYLRLNYNRLRFDDFGRFMDQASAANPRGRIHLYLSGVTMIDQIPAPPSETGVDYHEIDLPGDVWYQKLSALKAIQGGFLEGLDVSHTGITDLALERAALGKGFQQLTLLNLSGNKRVTDSALKILEQHGHSKNITSLDLSDTGVSNAGLAYLEDCTKLKTLRLASTTVTDRALMPLVSHNEDLTELDVSDTPTMVALEALSAIGKLVKVRKLNLAGTGVDDVGLKVIWGQQHVPLERWLVGAQGRDEKEQSLKAKFGFVPSTLNLAALEWLDVSKTKVTDRGLIDETGETGVRFFRLRTLYTSGTKITPGGLNRYVALRSLVGPINFEPANNDISDVIPPIIMNPKK